MILVQTIVILGRKKERNSSFTLQFSFNTSSDILNYCDLFVVTIKVLFYERKLNKNYFKFNFHYPDNSLGI